MLFQALASIGTGIIIGFVYSWALALFILGFMPFILLGSMLQMKIAKGFSSKGNELLEEAGKVKKLIFSYSASNLYDLMLLFSNVMFSNTTFYIIYIAMKCHNMQVL